MAGFQEDSTQPGLYYPSATAPFGGGLYSPAGLTETPAGSNLYAFDVGDYAYPSLIPVPHVEMTIFETDPATVTITVYRTVKNRTAPVPGQIGVPAVGGVNVADWDAPFGVPLTYQAQQFDADGNTLGYTRPFATQLDYDHDFVHNVFDPAGGTRVTLAGQALGALKRSTPTDVHYPAGSGLAVGISGQRRGLTDVDVSFLTFDITSADKVDAMFGDPYTSPSVPPVLCIRPGGKKNTRLPAPFYALITDPTQVPLNLANGGQLIRWESTATEVARPAPVLVIPVFSYEARDAAYPTYEAMDAAYSTYLEADRDYSLLIDEDAATDPTDPTPTDSIDPPDFGTGTFGTGTFGR